MTFWRRYLHKGDDRRAHKHERGVQRGPQQKGEGEPAPLRELVNIWRSSRTTGSFSPGLPAAVLRPSLLGPECPPPWHEMQPRSHTSPTWMANTPGSEASHHRPAQGCTATPRTRGLRGGARAPFCAGDYRRRILSLTTLYFRPATFSTTMSMKQATRPVRIPIIAQMTQRFISTVRKACGEGSCQKWARWGGPHSQATPETARPAPGVLPAAATSNGMPRAGPRARGGSLWSTSQRSWAFATTPHCG